MTDLTKNMQSYIFAGFEHTAIGKSKYYKLTSNQDYKKRYIKTIKIYDIMIEFIFIPQKVN